MQGTEGDDSGAVASAQGRRLGRYLLRTRIAQGGMASVYLAQLSGSEGFNKWMAVKVIHPQIAEDPNFVQMFLNEARLAARLDHPNICSVFDFGEAEGTFYLAMEYLQGEPLSNLLKKAWATGASGMPLHLAARILADAAQGLHFAHELADDNGEPLGVVHRDISPQNIFVLYSGMTKVVDFGIARSSENLGEKTATGIVKGKVAYMAPEQARGDVHLDRRADVWALGVVLWELTLGKRLFKRNTDVATILSVIQEPILKPRTLAPDYPQELERIVMKALERDPEQRYETARAMARDLEQFLVKAGQSAQSGDVADFMESSFREERNKQQKLLRAAAQEAGAEGLAGVSGNFKALPSNPPAKGQGRPSYEGGEHSPAHGSESAPLPRPALPKPPSVPPRAPPLPVSQLPVRKPQETVPIPLAKPVSSTKVGAIAPAAPPPSALQSSPGALQSSPGALQSNPAGLPVGSVFTPLPNSALTASYQAQPAPPQNRNATIAVLVLMVLSVGALVGALLGQRSTRGGRVDSLPPGTVVVLPVVTPLPAPHPAAPPPAPPPPPPPVAPAPAPLAAPAPAPAPAPAGAEPTGNETSGRRRRGRGDGDGGAASVAVEGTGTLSVGGSGAEGMVFEGRTRLGTLPLVRLSVPAGNHRLRIFSDGHWQNVEVAVEAERDTFVPVAGP